MSKPSTQKGDITRSEILKAANSLFVTQGFHGTSMRQIANSANIALGSIYNHFSGKEEIFETIFHDNHPLMRVLPAIERARGDTIEAFVHDAANLMVETIFDSPDFLNLMFIETVEFNNRHLHGIFKTTFPRGIKIAEKLMETEGNLRNIPTPILVRTFISFFFSYYLADVIIGNAAPSGFKDDAMAFYIDIFLHGILAND
jgi:AcrR family transcriptional regulator